MGKLVELSDGTWVSEERFVECFSVLQQAYQHCQDLTAELEQENRKVRELEFKIKYPDEPDQIFGKKAAMKKQQEECQEKLKIVKENIGEILADLESMEQTYVALRAKLLHEDFHDDFAVRSICNFIVKGAAKDMKTALSTFHSVKYSVEELKFYMKGQKGLDELKKEQGRAEKRAESLRKQLSAYESQTARNKKAERDSMISAQVSAMLGK